MPGFAVYDVHLSAPLGQRRLLDGLTGSRVPLFDVAGIVRPTYLIAPPKGKPERIAINGHPALEFPGAISWTERGQRLTVSSEDLPDSELIAVAKGMRA
jgi:hypothetical protein